MGDFIGIAGKKEATGGVTRADGGIELVALTSGGTVFAGGVDGHEDQLIDALEGGDEFEEEFFGAGVAVRLEDYAHPLGLLESGDGEHRLDFGGMVGVVNDHANGRSLRGEPLKTALGEFGAGLREGLSEGRGVHAQEHAGGHGAEGVCDVVSAGDGEGDLRQMVRAMQEGEAGFLCGAPDVLGAEHGVLRKAVGKDGAMVARGDAHGPGGVCADGDALARVVDDGGEATLQFFRGGEVIEVVELDVGDEGDGGVLVGQGTIALVRLGDGDLVGRELAHQVAMAGAGVGEEARGVTAQAPEGILPDALEEPRGETGGSGLAVGATDGDGAQTAHPAGQAFTTRKNGDAAGLGEGELGFVGADGGAVHEHIAFGQVGGVVALTDGDAVAGEEAAEGGRHVEVTPGDSPTAEVEHPGDAGGAHAADTHDVDAARGKGEEVERGLHCVVLSGSLRPHQQFNQEGPMAGGADLPRSRQGCFQGLRANTRPADAVARGQIDQAGIGEGEGQGHAIGEAVVAHQQDVWRVVERRTVQPRVKALGQEVGRGQLHHCHGVIQGSAPVRGRFPKGS